MRVKIRFYAVLAEAAGTRHAEIEAPRKAGPEEILKLVSEKFPGVGRLVASRGLRITILRNGSVLDGLTELEEGDEIALLPPSSGG